jgi:transmembrane protein EpsG
MTILWINLAIVFLCAFFSRYYTVPAVYGVSQVKPNKLLLFIVLTSLILVSGLRRNIGDTYFYMHAYRVTDYTWEYIKKSNDFGFHIFQMVLKQLSTDPQILVFSTALITNLLIVTVFYKYSRRIDLSIYVYITGGLFLVSMNGIRQCLAASIIFIATKYIINGDFKKYAALVLLASTIHQSAFILIPIYFLIRKKAWSWYTFLLLFLSLLIVVGYNQFSSVLFSALDSTQYGHYSSFQEGGANIWRVLVNAAPLLLAFIGREKLKEIFPNSDYIVNLSLIGILFMIVSTQNWIFARVNIYFELYNLILISWIPSLFRKNDRTLVYYSILILYFLYYIYENIITLGIIYNSDYIKW